MTGTVRARRRMAPAREVAGRRIRCCGREALLVLVLAVVLSGAAAAEQASQPAAPAAGQLDVSGGGDSGGDSSGYACARLGDGTARCWGFGGTGQLGYGATATIGDDETPGSTGPVDLGPGRTVKAISAGAFHTCALLDDGTVRCWGFGGDGRLGYANTNAVGDDESPGSVGLIDLGVGRTAVAISAGGAHTCAVLDNGSVRCWGFGSDGRLGYGNRASIGDDETPGAVAPVDLGPGRTAKAISAGRSDTCALLDNGAVSCWGLGANGQLGYGNDVRAVGDDETPASVGVVDLGPGRTAKAISAGGGHTCALLDDGAVRCWGFGGNGRLGYANTNTVGDDETPGSVGPVDLGPGGPAAAISAGGNSTCARLPDGGVRCWGDGTYGRLGYCNTDTIGDDETPGAAGPVELGPPGGAGTQCAVPPPASAPPPAPAGPSPLPAGGALPPPPDRTVAALAAQTRRFAAFRSCLQAASRRVPSRRSPARRRCRLLHGRTPGQVATLAGEAAGRTTIRLTFRAVGTDDAKPPAARNYLVKQSRRPIRTPLEVRRANALCDGNCRFSVTAVGTKIILTITQLRRHTTYYYVVVARDNVTARPGPRSRSIRARTP